MTRVQVRVLKNVIRDTSHTSLVAGEDTWKFKQVICQNVYALQPKYNFIHCKTIPEEPGDCKRTIYH